MTTTALATRQNGTGITALIEQASDRLTPFLPDGLTIEKLGQIVFFESKKNPDLLKCGGPSIVAAIARALRTGLEIGDTCYLVPYGTTCTFVADYRGLAQLMIASRAVRAVEGEAVYEGDDFDFELGLNARLRHVPRARGAKRGKITGAYVILRLPGGMSTFKYLPVEEIEAVRQKHSRQWKRQPLEEIPWYAVKTCLRQAAKMMPKDPRLTRFWEAVADEDRIEAARPVDVSEDGEDLAYVPPALPTGAEVADEDDPEAILAEDAALVEREEGLGLQDRRPAARHRNAVSEGR